MIPFIATGIVLSLVFGIEYKCQGEGMFPEYYGSPFVFKQESLASSMEYYYSISGLILNIGIWSILIYFINIITLKLIKKTGENRIPKMIYKGVIILLIGFSTLNIVIDSGMTGLGFQKGLNYWYMDLDKEAKDFSCVFVKSASQILLF